ncbi:hypothetical protein, partial [Bartonella sp. AC134YNZD]|uniref:hypothetical protein n=1 Tax=Bartonella sp. AC134YNZD TaxID=3243446 RepID=UPI0035CF37BA
MRWFDKLPVQSISTWQEMAKTFAARFIANSKAPRTADFLLDMHQGQKEPLRRYAQCYWEAFHEIDGCPIQLALTTFKVGLPRDSQLRRSLIMRLASDMSDLLERIDQHARVEDDVSLTARDVHQPSQKQERKERSNNVQRPRQE